MTNFRVPFICKFKPPGIATKEGYQQVDEKQLQEYYDDYYDQDLYNEPDFKEDEDEEEMYVLKVHQLLLVDGGEKQATLLETRSDSNEVGKSLKKKTNNVLKF